MVDQGKVESFRNSPIMVYYKDITGAYNDVEVIKLEADIKELKTINRQLEKTIEENKREIVRLSNKVFSINIKKY